MKDFGKRLAAVMKANGLTQHELARRIGADQPTVWGWLPPRNSLPAARHLTSLYVMFPSLLPTQIEKRPRQRERAS